MGLPKGRTNNAKGKPKGIKSARILQWEALGEALISKHSERANRILDDCDDDVFFDNYTKLLEYFRPKLARTELTGNDGDAIVIRTLNITAPKVGDK